MSVHIENHNSGHRGSHTGSVQSNHRSIPSTKAGSGAGARKIFATSERKGPTRKTV